MNIDKILALVVRTIKTSVPDAIYKGSLIKKTRAFDPSSSTMIEGIEVVTPAEIIFDVITAEEVIGTTIKYTDVKLHIIANDIKTIDFYQLVKVDSKEYKIKKLLTNVVGSKAALFTVIAEL